MKWFKKKDFRIKKEINGSGEVCYYVEEYLGSSEWVHRGGHSTLEDTKQWIDKKRKERLSKKVISTEIIKY